MNWSKPIDIYCERTDAAFWSEPVNALTNLAFILAALWGWHTVARCAADDPARRGNTADGLLIALTISIGIGSFLFHTVATRWAALADVVPIALFVVTCATVLIARLSGRPMGLVAVAVLAGLAILTVGSRLLLAALRSEGPDPLNGSGQYAPALIALYLLAAVLVWRRHPIARWIGAAALVFTASLVFRAIDLRVCATLPLGTHFLWHLLNGATIALLLQAALRIHRPNISDSCKKSHHLR